jgi:thiamine-monophosphate kinase
LTQKTPNEFELIHQLWAPLTLGAPGAFGLKDDVAQLPPSAFGQNVTCDQVIEGTHFLPDDPLDLVAKRLVRRNLSDLVAKGCRPLGAFLTLAWPRTRPISQMTDFAKGLGEDLTNLCGNCPLYGGDTSTSAGPLVATLFLVGEPLTASKRPVLRSGARPGDHVYVTGVIGDAYLGLQVRLGQENSNRLEVCQSFSMAPVPTALEMAGPIARFAHASIDVSDGLLADATHLVTNSKLTMELALECLPLSSEASAWVKAAESPLSGLLKLATGGDDYQALICLPKEHEVEFARIAQSLGTRLTKVGRCVEGDSLTLSYLGQPVKMPAITGWRL